MLQGSPVSPDDHTQEESHRQLLGNHLSVIDHIHQSKKDSCRNSQLPAKGFAHCAQCLNTLSEKLEILNLGARCRVTDS